MIKEIVVASGKGGTGILGLFYDFIKKVVLSLYLYGKLRSH